MITKEETEALWKEWQEHDIETRSQVARWTLASMFGRFAYRVEKGEVGDDVEAFFEKFRKELSEARPATHP